MYLTYVRHRVQDYDRWRKGFDQNAALMFGKFGVLSTTIVKVNGDPTDIAIINTWPSKKHWDDFGAAHESPEYKGKAATPESAGVIGEVEFCGGEAEAA